MSSWFWVSALKRQFIFLNVYSFNLILAWKPTPSLCCSPDNPGQILTASDTEITHSTSKISGAI